jgi:hypothetical protein
MSAICGVFPSLPSIAPDDKQGDRWEPKISPRSRPSCIQLNLFYPSKLKQPQNFLRPPSLYKYKPLVTCRVRIARDL